MRQKRAATGPDPYHMGMLVGPGHKAWRYMQKKDRRMEKKMLDAREKREQLGYRVQEGWFSKIDVEAFYCSLMMLDCYLNERVSIEKE